jgi:hypothetical protein
MKRWHQATFGLTVFLATGWAALSQTVEDAAEAPTQVRAELSRLVHADAARLAAGNAVVKVDAGPDGGPLVMSPYILREFREPTVERGPPDSPLLRFVKSGTLYHHVGKRVTTNILLHFYKLEQWSGGNIPPGNGIELGMFLSW